MSETERLPESDAVHEEALAAMLGLTLWRAQDALPAATAEQAPRGVLGRLPPLAWSLLIL